MSSVHAAGQHHEEGHRGSKQGDKMKLSSKISDSLWRGVPDSAKKKKSLRQMRHLCDKVSELLVLPGHLHGVRRL